MGLWALSPKFEHMFITVILHFAVFVLRGWRVYSFLRWGQGGICKAKIFGAMEIMSLLRSLFACLALLALVACDTAEERAEAHHKRGLELVAAGEIDKAILEFRNALQLNEDALEPRLEFAKLLVEKRDFKDAVGNFQRVLEIDPGNLEARKSLGRIMLLGGQSAQAADNINAALELAPDDIEVQGMKATLDLREGRSGQAVRIARAILEREPNNIQASLVLYGHAMNTTRYEDAVDHIDGALSENGTDFALHYSKLRALEFIGDNNRIGAQLLDMTANFPDNPDLANGLSQWHLRNNNADAAEKVLRDLAARHPENTDYALAVVIFLRSNKGNDAARTELAELVSRYPNASVFIRAQAELDVREGKPIDAISRLDQLMATGIDGNDAIATRTALAQILISSGEAERAKAVVAEILEQDPKNIDALVMRARDAINNDRPEIAINDLRTALDAAPQNPGILTLLAQAHERNGSNGLAQERLALAVRASDQGVAESIRYAEFLARNEKFAVAEETLKDALEKHPQTPQLMGGLARVLLQQSKWSDAERIALELDGMQGNAQAEQISNEIRIASATGTQKMDQSIGVLRQIWEDAGEKTSAMENLVRTYLRNSNPEEAATFLDGILVDEPKNMRANLLRGAVHVFADEGDLAEARYRKVIAEHPAQENGYGALAGLFYGQGRVEEADAIILSGIENAQSAVRLLFARAARLEAVGDFEGAIAMYERLYDANKVSDVLANNLASLLSDHRDDPASLEKAYAVAKRLRSSTEPAFQDTYGWILYQRGEYERAVQPLVAASVGIPNNSLVQYHLGMLYKALEQDALAITQLERSIALANDAAMPHIAQAKSALDEINAK
jgi:predicted Zn-dependent protease